MLTDLADVARTTGLPVVEVAGWQARGHGPQAGVRTIVCHHTAGPSSGDAPSLATVRDGRPDLAGPLSHFVLGRTGTVYVVAAGLCWHAGATLTPDESNAWSIGIEAEATGVDPWPDVQYDAYTRLCRALAAHYGLSADRVLGHKEVCAPPGRKQDPNLDMAAFRTAVASVALNPHPTVGDPVLIERVIPAGVYATRIICPVGKASAYLRSGWVSAVVNGPALGTARVWFQDDRGGVPYVGPGAGPNGCLDWTIGFADGHSGRIPTPIPDGTTQIVVQCAFPQGGLVTVEAG